MKKNNVSFDLSGNQVTLESGRLARQADGSVLVQSGNNVVLVAVVSSRSDYSENDFFPLTVEYAERFYSVGKIPGGYFKREGRPAMEAILNCRLIDRHLRPCFPELYQAETQVVAKILSYDSQYSVTSLASIGASAALQVSDIPFQGPTAAVQVCRVNGDFVINPSEEDRKTSDLSLFMAGTEKGILMVEGEAEFATEADVLECLKKGHEAMKPCFEAQKKLRDLMGAKEKRKVIEPKWDEDFSKNLSEKLTPEIKKAFQVKEKVQRGRTFSELKVKSKEEALSSFSDKEKEEKGRQFSQVFEDLKYDIARKQISEDKSRIDGRGFEDIRPISCEVGLLPKAHGSGLFTRGETQVLGTVTLGSGDDEQMIDSLEGFLKKQFLLHYNFPPFCVGEVGRMGGQSRREIGHGFLAERGLKKILPNHDDFPYTIRIVGEVLESNGSSSMGTVCSGMLALLDAGVPVKKNIAGIAMGLIQEKGEFFVLSDILGDEDHLGDMDFKVVGSHDGITAVQMDIKIESLDFAVLEKALNQAKKGRVHILDEMEKSIKGPREEMSPYAPRIHVLKVKPDKVREVIGSGGKVIRGITEKTGVKIDIEDSGLIKVVSADKASRDEAVGIIEGICKEVEEGEVYKGKVVNIKEFGAFVEIFPNSVGLLHISEIDRSRINKVTDVLNLGDIVEVKVTGVDRSGKIRLSRKALL